MEVDAEQSVFNLENIQNELCEIIRDDLEMGPPPTTLDFSNANAEGALKTQYFKLTYSCNPPSNISLINYSSNKYYRIQNKEEYFREKLHEIKNAMYNFHYSEKLNLSEYIDIIEFYRIDLEKIYYSMSRNDSGFYKYIELYDKILFFFKNCSFSYHHETLCRISDIMISLNNFLVLTK